MHKITSNFLQIFFCVFSYIEWSKNDFYDYAKVIIINVL